MKGQIWAAESSSYQDPTTGATVRQLTRHRGHSAPPYFTVSAWYDAGRRLLFASDRHGATQLFTLELATGALQQLTERPAAPATAAPPSLPSMMCVNPARPEAYWWYGRELVAVDLQTLAERTLYEVPHGFFGGLPGCTADGQAVCTTIVENLHHLLPQIPVELFWYTRDVDRLYLEQPPLSRILLIATADSRADVVWEEHYFLGHSTPSPSQPHLLFFAREAPWHLQPQCLWGLDWTRGTPWPLRPQQPGEQVGHPYWLHDGVRVGYHGRNAQNQHTVGFIRYDNTEHQEAVIELGSMHMHTHDGRLIVGDGRRLTQPYLLLWRWEGEQIEGPRRLCWHRGSSHVQQTHVHPRFSPDGRSVLFTSDATGYGNLYLVEVPEFDSLPPLPQ